MRREAQQSHVPGVLTAADIPETSSGRSASKRRRELSECLRRKKQKKNKMVTARRKQWLRLRRLARTLVLSQLLFCHFERGAGKSFSSRVMSPEGNLSYSRQWLEEFRSTRLWLTGVQSPFRSPQTWLAFAELRPGAFAAVQPPLTSVSQYLPPHLCMKLTNRRWVYL